MAGGAAGTSAGASAVEFAVSTGAACASLVETSAGASAVEFAVSTGAACAGAGSLTVLEPPHKGLSRPRINSNAFFKVEVKDELC